jgi:chromosome segregation ATPase|tara:strand:+ start:586 stop:858 length:273 start_codon:yes stop_codon:yes gene_type:complete
MRLRSDVLTSTNDGLLSEKAHLQTELKETRILYRDYSSKWNETNALYKNLLREYQELKTAYSSYEEMTKNREARIDKLKNELRRLQDDYE